MTISGIDILVIKGKNYPQATYTLYLSSMSISGDRFEQESDTSVLCPFP